MSKYFQIIQEALLDEAKKRPFKSKLNKSYEGHEHKQYPLKMGQVTQVAKDFLKEHKKDMSFEEFVELLDELYRSKVSTEKYVASKLLAGHAKFKKQVQPAKVDEWLDFQEGWAEVDTLCQSIFNHKDLDRKWDDWKSLIKQLNTSKNINKRRASLVLLIKSVRSSKDEKFLDLALENIESLKHEKDILITKAISWLLREATKQHKKKISDYLEENKDSLPAIAVRETSRKIKTGKK
jgi:3-methyladenine DNA glycosylase AlkD